MGFSLDISVPIFTVFLQGLLSFFSPCVLPLIPLYIGYLSGGTKSVDENGNITYKRSKVMVNTLFFVIGISMTFFILGLGISALGSFFSEHQMLFARIGGIIIIFFGLYQLGFFGKSNALGKEHRLPFKLNTLAMSPFTALLMGFTFSFAWTPCVGPTLTSVLLMAASAKNSMLGFLLIAVYTLGFVLPFLAVGLFTGSLLGWLKKHGSIVKYTVRIGAVLMILIGVMMLTGQMNSITNYLSSASTNTSTKDTNQSQSKSQSASENATAEKGKEDAKSDSTEETDIIDFTLLDQYGKSHTLSDYKGKTVFLNFWGTWCPPCKAEMPDIQKIYEETQQDADSDLVILGIAAPGYSGEGTEEEIKSFLSQNEYTYPVVFDLDGSIFSSYSIRSFPTTYMISANGKIHGYISGQLTEDMMQNIIDQTVNAD